MCPLRLARSMEIPQTSAGEAARRVASGEAVLIDVREPFELARASVAAARHVPMREIPSRVAELPRDKPILVMCHHGGRSQAVAEWLAPQGFRVENVVGGIDAWATEVDPKVPRY